MDKLKATVSYKQFDAPRAGDQAWPILEKMARAKSALSQPTAPMMAAPAPMAPALVTAAPVTAPTGGVAPAAAPMAPDVLVSQAPAEGSLFQRLQADTGPAKAAAFSRYGAAQPAQDAPQALSEIFERIGRKAL
jgi:hypothetical protein